MLEWMQIYKKSTITTFFSANSVTCNKYFFLDTSLHVVSIYCIV